MEAACCDRISPALRRTARRESHVQQRRAPRANGALLRKRLFAPGRTERRCCRQDFLRPLLRDAVPSFGRQERTEEAGIEHMLPAHHTVPLKRVVGPLEDELPDLDERRHALRSFVEPLLGEPLPEVDARPRRAADARAGLQAGRIAEPIFENRQRQILGVAVATDDEAIEQPESLCDDLP